MRVLAAAAFVAPVLLALAACTGAATAKAGGQTEPTVLSMVLAEGEDVAYGPAVERFVAAAHEASGGSLVVDVTWEPPLRTSDSEAALITDVRSGEADLSHVPARTFDQVGIDHFVALQDPFTLGTLAAADAVAAGPVAEQMLADLAQDGLVGLGMYAENLRRPVGYRAPLLRPEDFQGVVVRAQPSELTYDLLSALGARPAMSLNYFRDDGGLPFDAAESTWSAWRGRHPFPAGSVVTGNMVLFPKFNVFVANPETFAALDDPQREALRAAAEAAARSWTTTDRPDEQRLAEEWCTGGRRVVMANPADLAAAREAVRPVLDDLEADADTAQALRAVRQVAAESPGEPFELPPWCEPPTGDGVRLTP